MQLKSSNLLIIFGIITAFCLIFGLTTVNSEEDRLIVEVVSTNPHELAYTAFTLNENVLVKIEATGIRQEKKRDFSAYGWILNGDTRHIVWDFRSGSAKTDDNHDGIHIVDQLLLGKGNYEIYFVTQPMIFKSKKGLLNNFFGASSRYYNNLGIRLYCVSGSGDCQQAYVSNPISDKQAIVQMIEIGDNCYKKDGFSLPREMDLRIYAIGEGNPSSREMSDYAWIMDARTRRRVWEMNTRNTKSAGGSSKNRVFDDIITLPAGDYLVHYVSDDSHSFEEWNANPPDDPRYWGITIWSVQAFERSNTVQRFEETSRDRFIITQMTRLKDDEYRSQGFGLKRQTRLHIYALGEGSAPNRMVDYGWIIDAHSRQKVWQMDYENTEQAGGSRKNRLFDGYIFLPPGDYIVYYITDDSHAYGSWNEGPPYNPDAWGISIWGSDAQFNQEWLSEYREDQDPALIAQIIRVGDDEKIKEKFHLSERTRIRIYAIGEGDRSEMHDFGWIENHRGRKVWEMEYRRTEHAGGARKNRKVDEIITLDAGTYYLYYRTDDNHSFEDWNAPAPFDPLHWGISLMRVQSW